MIDVDATFKAIRSVYQTVSGKGDQSVSLIYKGLDYGVTKPWNAKIDAREVNHEAHDGALLGLLAMLKKELSDKTKSAESEAVRLRQALNQLGN
jgi:hypothetical protein